MRARRQPVDAAAPAGPRDAAGDSRWPPTRILVPVDYSGRSRRALEHAAAIARDTGARIVALHVGPHEPSAPGSLPTQGAEAAVAWTEGLADHRTIELRRLAEELSPDVRGVDSCVRYAQGDPAQEIVRTSLEDRCDLIVIASHGRTGLGRALLGSVTERTIRHATCPVLVLR